MEEFLPENVDKSTIDIIKEDDLDDMDEFLSDDSPSKVEVDIMDEFLPEDIPSFYTPSLLTGKSNDRTEAISHDEVHHQHVAQQYLNSEITHQISLPKLEIIDIHTDENDRRCPEINGDTESNVSYDKERSVISSSRVAQAPTEHKCEICGSSFTDEKNLRIHLRKKHPLSIDSEYICEICNKRFATQHGLGIHSNRRHPSNAERKHAQHRCEICGSCYAESSNLRAHIRNKHPSSIDSEYICEICNQKFTSQTGLNRHSTKMHPEAQTSARHKCEICGSCYAESGTLRAHIRNKHPSSIDSEYICEICNQKFTTQPGLDRHFYLTHAETRTPGEHKCEICGNCYMELNALRIHIRNKHPSSIDSEYICKT
ncbi:uncharacterized protein [Musca autumnalis]|uniref:uncharacterized protein n=1 Tax=Musca autumnalis TaxID=221902 RepID=UPI003CF4402E